MVRPKLGDLVGKRFVNKGRDVQIGLDCWGLVMEVYKRYGITLPDFRIDSFAFQTIDVLTRKEVDKRAWEEIYEPCDKDAPLVVLMRMHPVLITHAGVFIGDNKIIHTMKGTGVIISKVDMVQSRIAGYYRYVQHN